MRFEKTRYFLFKLLMLLGISVDVHLKATKEEKRRRA